MIVAWHRYVYNKKGSPYKSIQCASVQIMKENYQHVSNITRGNVECSLNHGRCFVYTLKIKFVYGNGHRQGGNLEWCNTSMATCSGKSKEKAYQYIHSSLFLHLYQLVPVSCLSICVNTDTLTAVFMRVDYNITTTALALVYWYADMERPPQKRITKATFILSYLTRLKLV